MEVSAEAASSIQVGCVAKAEDHEGEVMVEAEERELVVLRE